MSVVLLTQERVNNLNADLRMVLKAVAAKHGLDLNKQHVTWSPNDASLRVIMTVEGGKSKDQVTYDRYKLKLGLPALETDIALDGKNFKVQGMRVGGPHKTVILRCTDPGPDSGKLFKLSARGFKAKIGLP